MNKLDLEKYRIKGTMAINEEVIEFVNDLIEKEDVKSLEIMVENMCYITNSVDENRHIFTLFYIVNTSCLVFNLFRPDHTMIGLLGMCINLIAYIVARTVIINGRIKAFEALEEIGFPVTSMRKDLGV